MVDHNVLLQILETEFHVSGSALVWFKSFIIGRTQHVKTGSSFSDFLMLESGLPEGSLHVPVLYNVNSFPLPEIFSEAGFQSSSFADHNSAFAAFSLYSQYDTLTVAIPACFSKIKLWMTRRFLKINDGKTQIMVFGNNKFLNQVVRKETILESGVCIYFSNNVKYLPVGVLMVLTSLECSTFSSALSHFSSSV